MLHEARIFRGKQTLNEQGRDLLKNNGLAGACLRNGQAITIDNARLSRGLQLALPLWQTGKLIHDAGNIDQRKQQTQSNKARGKAADKAQESHQKLNHRFFGSSSTGSFGTGGAGSSTNRSRPDPSSSRM